MDIYNQNKPTILIVEDDYSNQKFLTFFLKRNFNVFPCDSEESLFEHLNKHKIDLILMDISIQGKKDGLQITKDLKISDKFKNIPVVCLTAHAFQIDKDNALKAGVDYYLTKPVSNDILLNTLLAMLNKKKLIG